MTRRNRILSDFPQTVYVGRDKAATAEELAMEYLTRRARKIDTDLPPCAALPAPVTVFLENRV